MEQLMRTKYQWIRTARATTPTHRKQRSLLKFIMKSKSKRFCRNKAAREPEDRNPTPRPPHTILGTRNPITPRMFRNQYDTDVTTWSPQGRLFQVEYAMEAVKQGSACVGLRSRTHAVLAAVNKAASELSSHQRKVFRVAEHAGVALAGLTADGRVLSRFLRSECINHSFVYDAPLPVSRLALRLADKAQVCTQRSWKRPYGVGLLVAGLDETGAHLYYNCPSGNYFEYQAFAIGSRSQAAKTFLERRFEGYNDYTPELLIKDALSAIKETLQGEKLTSSNCTVAIVGRKDDGTMEPFETIDAKRIQEIIDSMEAAEVAPAEPSAMQQEGPGTDAAAPMDI